MSTRKQNNQSAKKQPAAKKPAPAPKKAANKWVWIGVGVAAVLVVGAFALANAGGGSGGSIAAAPASEQKYLGRLLPAKYTEPKVADVQVYSSAVEMTDVKPEQNASSVSLPVSELVAKKIVYFEYKRADGQSLPMLAYVKPSGKLFVGVSYCPPCKGKRQSIQPDITLTCSTCGTKRNLETGVGLSGACKLYPTDELPATVSGGKIVISNTAMDSWSPQPMDRPTGA